MCQVLQKVFRYCLHHHSFQPAIPCYAGFYSHHDRAATCLEGNNQVIGRTYTTVWVYCAECQIRRSNALKEAFRIMLLRLQIVCVQEQWSAHEWVDRKAKLLRQSRRELFRFGEACRSVPVEAQGRDPDESDSVWLEPVEREIRRETWREYPERVELLLDVGSSVTAEEEEEVEAVLEDEDPADALSEAATELLDEEEAEEQETEEE